MKENVEHNTLIIELASTLKLIFFYGGNQNVLRVKAESLKGNFYDVKMQVGENIIE